MQEKGKNLLRSPTTHNDVLFRWGFWGFVCLGFFNVSNTRAENVTMIFRLYHLKWSFDHNSLITLIQKKRAIKYIICIKS